MLPNGSLEGLRVLGPQARQPPEDEWAALKTEARIGLLVLTAACTSRAGNKGA